MAVDLPQSRCHRQETGPEGTFLRSTSTSGDTDSPVKQLSDTRTTGTGSVGAVTDAQGRLDLSQPLSASIGTERTCKPTLFGWLVLWCNASRKSSP